MCVAQKWNKPGMDKKLIPSNMQKDRPFVVVVVVVVAMLNFILSKYAFREVFEAWSVRKTCVLES